jgi:hypothetical protein
MNHSTLSSNEVLKFFATTSKSCGKLLFATLLALTTSESIGQRVADLSDPKSSTLLQGTSKSVDKGQSLTPVEEQMIRASLKENAETVRFIENRGQIKNKEVLYYFEGLRGSTYIEKNKIRFVAKDIEFVDKKVSDDVQFKNVTPDKEAHLKATHTFSLEMEGANANSYIEAGKSFATHYNFLLGDRSEWASGVKASKDLMIKNVYAGIDLRLYSNSDGSFEFDWIVAAGADFNQVNLQFDGQDNLTIENDGSLTADLRFTQVRFNIPESYQLTPSGKTAVDMSFEVKSNNKINFVTKNNIDSRYPLIIDPTLSWGTYFDGNNSDFDQYLFAIQVDTDGIVYCAGGTNQPVQTGSAPYDANGYLNNITGFGTGATPRVPIIYRISSNGSDLIDMTLYGPSSVSSNGSAADDNAIAYALSLSNNRVFIGGKTNVNIPMTANAFDNTRSAYDGFVAVFSKDLSTLHYSTYLGGSGDEDPGVTSIRAIDDNSFVVGFTAEAALPAAYLTVGVADNSFGGASDMYIAKFTSLNSISWGTYIGGSNDEVFNDLELFADGRVAFAGYGNGQLTEVNSAANRSTNTDNTDGVVGVLTSTGSAYNYLDEIGGSGTDRINDVQIVGNTLYFTGSGASGFPTSGLAYDTSHGGGSDCIVGSVDAAGSTNYKCTFYGGTGDQLGSGIRLVSQIDCDGIANSFLLVFGTTEGGLPTQNINSEPFFDSSNNGGLDIFFGGFKADLTGPLVFGTYMGGDENDYLGDTGAPRGANHLWVNGANVYVGTTIHSASQTPALVGNGGFDIVKTNNANPASDDTHVIFAIEFASLLGSDYGDAPASYLAPSHILDCPNLFMGTLVDDEASHQPSTNANGDDVLGSDDEDGITVLPVLTSGTGQNFSVTINTLTNTTGSTANLYGWIDFNGDGQFSVDEVATTTVANGFVGSKTLNWTGITVGGNAANYYLRVRLTTDALVDNAGTSVVDERSTTGASNGEVEDYRCSGLSCPVARTEEPCQTQASIDAKYEAWINTVTYGSPCGGSITVSKPNAPTICDGGTSTVTIEYTFCGEKIECSSTFTLLPSPAVVLTCPSNTTTQPCLSQTVVNTAYNTWLQSAIASGGCNGSLTNDGGSAPNVCTGGTKTVTFTYTSSCAPYTTSCQATFTVPAAPSLQITSCPEGLDRGCNPQGSVPAPGTPTASGGCGTVNFTNSLGAVQTDGCLRSQTRTYTATDACNQTATCTQVFTWTVDTTPPAFTNCPQNADLGCNPQSIPGAELVTATDGCSTPTVTVVDGNVNSNGCNRSMQRIYTATDGCGNTATCEQLISWKVDIDAPTFTFCPQGADLGCNPQGVPAAGNAIATDVCGAPTITSSLGVITENGCNRSQTRTYTATDVCGNSSTCEQVFTWTVDIDAPTFTFCPQGADLGCNPQGVPAAGNAIATDACGAPTITSSLGVITENGCNRSQTRTYTATDVCGNSSTCEQVFTWTVDTTGPEFTFCPQGQDLGCNPQGVPAAGNAIATDVCGAPTITSSLGVITENGCNRSQTRTYTATDVCGNSSTCEQVFTWTVDTTGPEFTFCPQGQDLGCNPQGVPAAGNAIATDVCGAPTITSSLGVITENGCNRSQTRTYTATDVCGNSSTCEQVFTWTVDTTGPEFTFCPQGQDLGCNPQGVPAAGNAIATDVCGAPTITSSLGVITENGCNRSQTRTYTATDVCGNSSTCEQVFTWTVDTTGPEFTFCPQGQDLGCNPQGVPAAGNAVALDACGNPSITSELLPIIENGCMRSQTRMYTAIDPCGNRSYCNQIFTWTVDTDAPEFTFCPQGGELGCNPQGVPAEGVAIATDNCGTPTITSALGQISEDGCFRSVTRTYTATDACGNSSTCEQVFTWTVDTDAPVFTYCPEGGDLGCNPDGIPAAALPGITNGIAVAAATDECGVPVITASLGTISVQGCYRSQTRTYTATDACGNSSSCEQVFTWKVDTDAPTFDGCPAPSTAPMIYSCLDEVPAAPEVKAFDTCDGELAVDFTELESNPGSSCNNTITRTWYAVDECGNDATCTQIIYVNDTEKPMLHNVPADVSGACGDLPSPAQVTATDNCDNNVFIDYQEVVLSVGCPATVKRIWTAYDDCDNFDSAEQIISYNDEIDPEFTVCPQGGDLGCNPQGIPTAGGAIATDNCGIPVITDAPGDIIADGCYRSFTRTYTATDACGNTATCYQVFTWTVDTDAPEFTFCPQGGELGCNPQGVPAEGVAIATDNCGTPTITSALGQISEDGCFRSVTRTYTATDACGNSSTCEQVFTWTVDTDAPVFTYCPEGGDLGCNPDGIPAAALPGITNGIAVAAATDECGVPVITASLGTISVQGCYRSQTRTYTATDACGNSSSCEQVFTWKVDTDAPTFDGCPAPSTAPMIYSCLDEVPAAPEVKAFDTCDGELAVDFTELESNPGSSCNNTITRTWYAVDECGNDATCTQIIYVNDTEKPMLHNVPADVSGACGDLPSPAQVTATDNCDNNVFIDYQEVVLSVGCPATVKRIWTAYDDCDNFDSAEQIISYNDEIDPEFTVCPQGGDLGCNPQGIPTAGGAIATDNCGIPVITDAPGDIIADGCYRSFTRTYTATDACGNTATCYQVFTWTVDTDAPEFTFCPQGGELGCNPQGVPAEGVAIATDNCGTPTITSALGQISEDGCFRSVTRTYTATDACGNSSTCEQVFTWTVDTDAPVFTYCPEGGDLGCNPDGIPAAALPGITNGIAVAAATDECGVPVITASLGTISVQGCYRSQTRTYTATDACGNSSSCEQVFTWKVDTDAPTFDGCPAPSTAPMIYSCLDEVPAAPEVKAFDTCDGELAVDFTELESNPGSSCNNTITRTWYAVDECGNDATCTQIIYVNDTEKPMLHNVPADVSGACGDLPSPAQVTATDNCDNNVFIDYQEVVLSVGCPATVKRIWTAYDDCDNFDSAEQIISYNDEIDPEFTVCPQGGDLGCNPQGIPTAGGAIATDNCGIPVITDAPGDIIADGCYRSFTRTYTATDACGNTATCYQVFTWTVDTDAPEFTFCPQGGELGCNPQGVPAEGVAIATDNCGTPTITSALGQISEDGCFRSVTRTYTATDACGNSSTCEQVFTWTVDTDAPVFTYCPEGGDLGCNPDGIPAAALPGITNGIAVASATDECGVPVITASLGTISVQGCYRSQTRTYTATDACGNSSSCEQVFTWKVDTDAPTFDGCPAPSTAPMIYSCLDEVPAAADVKAFDTCDGELDVDFTEVESNLGSSCNNTITRTWYAVDACGNDATCTQIIYVNDTEKPMLHNVPADFNGQCGEIPLPSVVAATDNCDDDVFIDYDEDVIGENCPITIVRTWTAYDDCGNSDSATQTIIIDDTENPELVGVPANEIVECSDPLVEPEVTATDNCAFDLEVEYNESEPIALECGYYFMRSWYVVDYCGNEASASQMVTVIDTTAPTANVENAEITVECGSDIPPFIFSWSDNCDIELDSTAISSIGIDGCNEIISEVYFAEDDCGNVGSVSRIIHIVDTTAPYVTHPVADQFIQCDAEIVLDTPIFDDICDDVLVITYSADTTYLPQGILITRHFTATDDCGYSVTDDSDIVISLEEDPILVGLPELNVTIECGESEEANVVFGYDFCGNPLDVDFETDTIEDGCLLIITNTWTVTDNAGNETIFTQTINVGDTTDPTIVCPSDITVPCAAFVPDADINSVVASDNCGYVQITSNDEVSGFECANRYVITRTYTATDECGNTASCDQIITVYDETAPVFTYVPQGSASCGETVDFGMAIAEDNCGGSVIITHEDIIDNNNDDENCQYTTYSKGGWGSPSNSGPGSYRDANFAGAFPNGLSIGCEIGSYTFTTPQAIEDFLPSGGGASVLPEGNTVNPDADAVSNNFADQLIAAILNTGFDVFDPNFGASNGSLGNLVYAAGPFAGMTANSVIEIANDVIGGCSNAYTPVSLLEAMEEINLSFHEGTSNSGDLLCGDGGNNNQCDYTAIRIWTATDACGNTSTATTEISVTDNEDPTVDFAPANQNVECIGDVVYEEPVFSDNCDLNLDIEPASSIVQLEPCGFAIHKTWVASDNCGNETTVSQDIIVQDVTPPVLYGVPANVSAECGELPLVADVYALDNCDDNVLVTFDEDGEQDGCYYNITRTWTATDDCGNTVSAEQHIIVGDTTDPTIVWSAPNETIDCMDEVPAPIDPTFDDNCDEELVVLPASSIVDLECGYMIHRTWTATDDCGNSITAVQDITVIDSEAPVIDPYEIYQVVECELVESYLGITATDNCGEVHIDYVDDTFSGGCLGVIVRTYTVTDDCGNEAIAQQIISVQDNTGPVIENPADETVECENAPIGIPAINIYDACGQDVEILDASQEIVTIDECTYQIIWHWSARDYCENVSEATTTITVTDTTNPTISNLAPNQTFACDDEVTAPMWPIIQDNCDLNVEVYFAADTIQGSCPNSYDIIYTWRAMDDCDNEATESVVYQIRDLAGPIFLENNPSVYTYECDETVELIQPIAEDNCSEVTYTHIDSNFWNEGCDSGFTRIWYAADECENVTPFFQYINILDTTAPVVTGLPEVDRPCNDFGGIYITAEDNCNSVSIDFTEEHVSGTCAGRYIRTYEVSDECGNSIEFVQVINLIDTVAPEALNPISDLQIECGDNYPVYIAEFEDNCDQILDIVALSSISYSEDGCIQYINESWTATDDCLNSTTASRTITIVDTTDPYFTSLPFDHTYDCSEIVGIDLVFAADACDEDVAVDYSDVIEAGNCPASYTIVRTWTATDNCGNSAEYVQHIFVSDTQDPIFLFVPGPAEFSCEDDVDFGNPIVEDDCSTFELTFSDEYDYSCANTYTITRTWIATDACNNESTATSVYNVYDNEAPSFNQQLVDVNVECASEIPAPVAVTATDNCGQANVTVNVLEVESDNCGNQTLYVQYTAVDDCENVNYTGYYITVNDETDPELSECPGDLILDCNDEIPAPAAVTVSDNCDQNITIVFEEFMYGDLPAEGSIADCNLITPLRPAGNPCGYPYDWAMAMFGLPTAHRYYTVHNGNLVQYPNGTAHVTAEMRNVQNPANGWNIDMWFNNQMDWSQWSTQAFPTSFKADCGGEAINHFDWTYLIMQANSGAEMTGFGAYSGSSLNTVHAPANRYFGFQLGDGANNYNGAENGFGGWFSYNGFFQISSTPYGNNNGTISGAADLAFELDCCPDYTIVRQWTATDCSGNTTSCSQTISFGDNTDAPGMIAQPAKLENADAIPSVAVAPNPATNNTMFTFTPTQKAVTTLEVFDLAGAKVADVFVGTVEAGIEYKVDYNVSNMATGVYMYRLTNGENREIGRLIVNR